MISLARPSAARPHDRERLWIGVAVAAMAVALGAAIPTLLAEIRLGDVRDLALLLTAAFGVLVGFSSVRLARRDWFHPYAFPLLYISFVCTAPIVYLVLLRGQLAARVGPEAVTAPLVGVFGLTVLGITAGIAAAQRWTREPVERHPRVVNYRTARSIGRLMLAAALALRCYSVLGQLGLTYGTGVVQFGVMASVETAASFLLLAGIVLVAVANATTGRTLGVVDAGLFGSFVALTLVSGSRGELVAPALFLLWAHHTYVRRIPLTAALAMTVVVVLVFQGVAGQRAGESFIAGTRPLVERSLLSVGTPVQVSALLMERVPSQSPYREGATYVASLERLLPGALSVAILGPPTSTASFEFRSILRFTNPNAGFGFSLPSEGYLNFGLAGAFFAALLAGAALGYASRRTAPIPTRALHLLYPILIATLPLSFRSDALQQIKGVLYPMLLLAFVFWLCSRPRPRSG
jgi:O-antigen polysaccharide polymerase Wzy